MGVLKRDCADGCAALYMYPKPFSCILGLRCINCTSVRQLLKDHSDKGENHGQRDRDRIAVIYAKF